jgi:hypothetical protein
MTERLKESNSVNLDLENSITIDATAYCSPASVDLKKKSFFSVAPKSPRPPKTPRSPCGSLINATNVFTGSQAPIILLPISENPIIRRRKMKAEDEMIQDLAKRFKSADLANKM